MACERCGAQTASDGAQFVATFKTPSGTPLSLALSLASKRPAGAGRPTMFCDTCWLWFLQLMGEVGVAVRIIGEKTAAS